MSSNSYKNKSIMLSTFEEKKKKIDKITCVITLSRKKKVHKISNPPEKHSLFIQPLCSCFFAIFSLFYRPQNLDRLACYTYIHQHYNQLSN